MNDQFRLTRAQGLHFFHILALDFELFADSEHLLLFVSQRLFCHLLRALRSCKCLGGIKVFLTHRFLRFLRCSLLRGKLCCMGPPLLFKQCQSLGIGSARSLGLAACSLSLTSRSLGLASRSLGLAACSLSLAACCLGLAACCEQRFFGMVQIAAGVKQILLRFLHDLALLSLVSRFRRAGNLVGTG